MILLYGLSGIEPGHQLSLFIGPEDSNRIFVSEFRHPAANYFMRSLNR